ncbi:hypothetical protein OG785_01860 [Streptomyces sp. NBC_00006]|nr:hypothetical protein [Streptomyces sp. NBC_00006]MCX5529320.1 hypothetical protein [Streptomyces sp. NBC_00006]
MTSAPSASRPPAPSTSHPLPAHERVVLLEPSDIERLDTAEGLERQR